MVTETVIVEFRERGARTVRRRTEDIGRGARSAAGEVQLLRNTLGALGVGFSVALILRELGELSDSFINIQNRLRLVTDGQIELNAVFGELFDISQRTRSALEVNAELFNRLALSTKDLGVSQRELLQLTESLNQAVAISGATSQEANNALIQLSQGLASGALRGDELRSVLEQLPRVADVIAAQLDITRGQLRQFGKEGKLTAEVVLEAFKSAREELAGEFAETVPTLSQRFAQLRNQLTLTVGALQDSTGAAQGLGDIVADITQFVSEATPTLVSFVNAISGTLRPTDELSDGLKQVATVLIVLRDVAGVVITTLVNTFDNGFTVISNTVSGFAQTVQAVAAGEFDKIPGIIENALDDTAEVVLQNQLEIRDSLFSNTSQTIEGLTQLWDAGQREFRFDANTVEGQLEFLEQLAGFERQLDQNVISAAKFKEALEISPRGLAEIADALDISEEKLISLGESGGLAISTILEGVKAARVELAALNDASDVGVRVQGLDPKVVEEQQKFITALQETSQELQLQIAFGDDAALAIEEYRVITEAAALGNSEFVASAQAINDTIAEQQRTIQQLEEAAEQSAFVDNLRAQSAELQVQIDAGRGAAEAIERYRIQVEATQLGLDATSTEVQELTDRIQQQRATLQNADVIQGLEEEQRLLRLSNRERAVEIELRKLSADASEEQREIVRSLAEENFDQQNSLTSLFRQNEELSVQAARNIQSAFADFLFDPFDKSLDDLLFSFIQVLQRMAAEAAANAILRQLFASFGGGGGGTPAAANGINLNRGESAIVGEAGRPELVTASQAPLNVRALPATAMQPAQMQPPQVNLQVVNVQSRDEIESTFTGENFSKSVINVLEQNRDALRAL